VCLHDLGWMPFFASHFSSHANHGFVPGRVVSESNEIYRLATEVGERTAEMAGRLRYLAEERADLPAVGDWVAAQIVGDGEHDPAILHAVLPRRTQLTRKAPGRRTEAQIVAANVDTVFLLTSLNQDFNPRRLERYLALVREGGGEPVVVLSKADLCADPDAVRRAEAAVRTVAAETPVHAVSSLSGEGLDDLHPYLARGRTVALLGSSGVGKSTLVNRLLGEERQAVRTIREGDDRGRHTTTRRQLIPLPGGALLLDTPGMRELALWGGEEGAGAAFSEIESLAQRCRFPDCRHQSEPGCAVLAAVETGELPAERLANYDKLLKEEAYLEARKANGAVLRAQRKATARLHKAVQQHARRHKRIR
jgi:ribosome biogenesis GTPase / thiamine phosphate phosphatase